jgi:BirA family biotin operon repressor/biotin-[acetyl-CoA-carboxylase] ligase
VKLPEKVLAALRISEGAYVSGETLAKEFGVSRSAVWKCVARLKQEGYAVDAVTNRGYRLAAGALSAAAVTALLRGSARRCRIFYHGTLESTNRLLKKMAEDGAPEGTVVLANAQTRGRGQRGRNFFSPGGTGLYISVLLHRPLRFDTRRYLTAAAAVAAAEAIKEICALSVGIKWVNDIWVRGQKAGGILTEGSMEYESGYAAYAVLGLGLNIMAPARGFPSELAATATSLYAPGAEPAGGVRNQLAAEFLSRLFLYCERLEEKIFLPEYRRLSFLPGRRLACYGNGRVFTADALEIDNEANLVVRLSDGSKKTLSMGEVTVIPEQRR